jgi:hypothetical protein
MDAIRSRGADVRARRFAAIAVLAVLAVTLAPARAPADAPLRDAPVIWHEDDRHDISAPRERAPNLIWDSADDSVVRPFGRLTHPGRIVRGVGTMFGGDHVQAAANVNALDEAPNSTWFTNRIGLFPMSPEAVARGSGSGEGPDRGATWTIVKAKTEGVTPGFNIRDAKGVVHLIKFDPPGCPGMTTAAGVISNRILYAAGYGVPEDVAVTFRREDLVLGEKVSLTLPDGTKRPMTVGDIDSILAKVERSADGSWRALASRFLSGKPVGPFDYKGRRKDDPNDHVNHENRRELRGLRMFAAWINHFDTKQHNSLDMYVEDGDRHYVKHYLIDFASTLGAGAKGPTPRYGWEYTVDPSAFFGRLFALGIHEDAWRLSRRPEGLDEVGYWESARFDPLEFKPLQPNTSFANLTDRDGYWAAKIISAFTDEHLEAIVAVAGYENPDAAKYVARILGERRDTIARLFFDRVPPLDFFAVTTSADGAHRVAFHDLAVERGYAPSESTRYRFRAARMSAERDADRWSPWAVTTDPAMGSMEGVTEAHPFLAVEFQVDRGSGWSPSVTAYIAPESGRVVAVER